MTHTLYPEVNTSDIEEEIISVSDLHKICVRQAGNPDGMPVLFIHGGPGLGCSPKDFQFFDLNFYRVILVDQRGSGKSLPFGEMQENTLENLIQDFEKVREKFQIKKWLIFGGSWGSTLGLAYGQAHPEACEGFILRGIWLSRQQEIDFFFSGIQNTFPERAKAFYDFIPTQEQSDILQAYYTRLMNTNPEVHLPAARHFAEYEFGSAFHDPYPELHHLLEDNNLILGLTRTECHYMMHHMFLRHNQLLDDMHKISHLYGELVHGRYDAICPYSGAYTLKEKWPKAILTTVENGGHSASDPAIAQALVEATNRYQQHNQKP